ncbi:biogenesis of lysosome-related organelles complex 1 subunit 5 [Rhynchophorus ferrugineus]|uniref:Biogenesis of lysosome-related organelles complex 1 subunit 5 n=1 Tax=Rhynchophorus ferrugineus TaxID=354439 RepID=A0A834IZ86_RHYFE|nr:hypothetical protein GWI33_002831 [Rhynchophorus ferrugineus]
MSDVFKDISNIWDRLFDHKGFLSGEINFTLKEFEEKRGDNEVDNLFKTIENLTDIKDTHINQLKDNVNESVIESNRQLSEALQVCNNLSKLQDESNQNKLLDENINKRKLALDKFIDDITTEYSQINTEHEKQEANLRKVYEELEKKLI